MKYTVNYNLKKPEGTDVVNIDDFNNNADILDTEINSLNGQINTLATQDNSLSAQINNLVADYIRSPGYGVTTGSANIYALTLNPALATYTAGVCVAVKINVANTGASTININGLGAKPIKDSKDNALVSGKLVLNSVYTFRYDGTNFILQGEGGEYGTATASDVLSGKTIGTDSGLVTGTIPSKAAATITPSTIAQTIASGQYLSGIQTIAGDADLISANIKAGANIFGVSGSAPIPSGSALSAQVLTGYTFSNASGVGLSGSMVSNAVNQPVLNTQDQSYSIPGGYHSAGGKVTAHFNNLSAENVKSGVNVGGVVGNLAPAPPVSTSSVAISYEYDGGADEFSFPKSVGPILFGSGTCSNVFVMMQASQSQSRGTWRFICPKEIVVSRCNSNLNNTPGTNYKGTNFTVDVTGYREFIFVYNPTQSPFTVTIETFTGTGTKTTQWYGGVVIE